MEARTLASLEDRVTPCTQTAQTCPEADNSQEYLTLAEGEMERSAPRWLINHSVDADGPYLHVPVEIVPPACRPLLAPKGPLAFRIAGQPGDALKAALLKGAFLDN